MAARPALWRCIGCDQLAWVGLWLGGLECMPCARVRLRRAQSDHMEGVEGMEPKSKNSSRRVFAYKDFWDLGSTPSIYPLETLVVSRFVTTPQP